MNASTPLGFCLALVAGIPLLTGAGDSADWPSYLGDDARSHYSSLTQINRENVQRLEVAWTYSAGEKREGGRSQMQCNPLVIDGVLYGTTPFVNLIALDAASGRELWRFDPEAEASARQGQPARLARGVNRGVSYWAKGPDRRILFTAGHYLYAVDAGTGLPVPSFGDRGRVDFKQGLGRDTRALALSSTSPGAIFEDLYILTVRCADTPGPAAPGHIRAFDIRSGEQVWIFHTIPQPGEIGHDTWPEDAWKYAGGANNWAGLSVDHKRGLLYVPTGSPTYDYWGGNRPGENLFSNSLLCLDARTGRRVWHYQVVRHDLWDRDLPAPPNLLTIRRDGIEIPAVAQVTKSGHIFVFHRETGEPLFPIDEVAAPASDVPGEAAWPSQPVPRAPAPFARQAITLDDLTTRTPEVHRAALEQFQKLKPALPFQPPSLEGSVLTPGIDGGAEWGGAAVDEQGVLYVNASDIAWVITLVEAQGRGKGTALSHQGGGSYTLYCAGCHGADRQGNPLQGIPALTHLDQRMKRDEVLAILEKGRGVMPPFEFLPQSVRNSLTDYLLDTVSGTAPARKDSVEQSRTTPGYYEVPFVRGQGGRWLDAEGYPNVQPPWGTLNAVDLNTGEYRWKIPLGEYPELSAKGVPPTGTDNYGGPVVTAGGLLFIAATLDEKIRAFDKESGALLWTAKLPAAGYATPATYMVDGRQYLVIACGGGKLGSPSNDVYIAFALPPARAVRVHPVLKARSERARLR